MSIFTVRVEADAAKFPGLLSNGTVVARGAAAGGRHWVKYADPWPKPTYLFALVAGDLAKREDRFTTASGKDVALARDLTDTMYNPERPPGVDHFTGTDLVVSHVERHWCPSFVSGDLTGGKVFRFAGDPRR
jgi:hypothetical protein